MTPKQKAAELVTKFGKHVDYGILSAKACAIMCVDEIDKCRCSDDSSYTDEDKIGYDWDSYWTEVKQEIEKINE